MNVDGGGLTNLFSFDGTNGAGPAGGVTRGRDDNYYGLTSSRIAGTNSTTEPFSR